MMSCISQNETRKWASERKGNRHKFNTLSALAKISGQHSAWCRLKKPAMNNSNDISLVMIIGCEKSVLEIADQH